MSWKHALQNKNVLIWYYLPCYGYYNTTHNKFMSPSSDNLTYVCTYNIGTYWWSWTWAPHYHCCWFSIYYPAFPGVLGSAAGLETNARRLLLGADSKTQWLGMQLLMPGSRVTNWYGLMCKNRAGFCSQCSLPNLRHKPEKANKSFWVTVPHYRIGFIWDCMSVRADGFGCDPLCFFFLPPIIWWDRLRPSCRRICRPCHLSTTQPL